VLAHSPQSRFCRVDGALLLAARGLEEEEVGSLVRLLATGRASIWAQEEEEEVEEAVVEVAVEAEETLQLVVLQMHTKPCLCCTT